MTDNIKSAFEPEIIKLALDAILPLKHVPQAHRQSPKYRRIASSIAEVGIIEPLVVVRPKEPGGKHLLLDGHIRLAILIEMGTPEVKCLVSSDDEAFTYNKRVARLATIQEHYMIVRALERGVPEEKLAKALNVDVASIVRRRSLLNGICPDVVDLLKDKTVNPTTFDILRKMKPPRQIEAAELMAAAGNFTHSYAKALLAATRQHDLVRADRPKQVGGFTPEQMARMEREMETLQRDFKAIEASLRGRRAQSGGRNRVPFAPGRQSEITRFLSTSYPEFLDGFRTIIATASLDQAGPACLNLWQETGTRTRKRGDRWRRPSVGTDQERCGDGGEPVRSPQILDAADRGALPSVGRVMGKSDLMVLMPNLCVSECVGTSKRASASRQCAPVFPARRPEDRH